MGKCPRKAKIEGYLPKGQGGSQIFFKPWSMLTYLVPSGHSHGPFCCPLLFILVECFKWQASKFAQNSLMASFE